MGDRKQLLGVGLYSVPEAARLTRISNRRIRSWTTGYIRSSGKHHRKYTSVWRADAPYVDGIVSLTFRDLMEVRFVNAFREYGVTWKVIRLAALHAMEWLGNDHPFSMKSFRTDGRTIFADLVEDSGSRKLLDLVSSQYAFSQVISQSLYRGMEFSEADEVVRWWPEGKRKAIVVDPLRSFGQPIDSKSGVPTRILADACRAEGSAKRAASNFGVRVQAVVSAVEFEEKLAA